MQDILTRGSELLPLYNSPFRSTIPYPVNEDYTMLCTVQSVLEGIVTGHKVYDEATPKKSFEATLRYEGHTGTPPDTSFTVDEYVLFHRKAEGEFLCFLTPKIVFVTDSGDGNGVADGETKALEYSDPAAYYHDETKIWQSGRVYAGIDLGKSYKVYVPGFGPEANVFTATAGDITWTISTDAAGKVLEFSAE